MNFLCIFLGMMDIHSTQALLNLARSGNFLPPTSGSSAFSPPAALEATKKRPATSEALDLSPPTGAKKAKIEAKSATTSVDPTVLNWSVSDVCQFVSSIDICREYTEVSFESHSAHSIVYIENFDF